jgi:hypothetical protein
VFDREFFRETFPDRVREFATEQGATAVTLMAVTRDGTYFDTQEFNTNDAGIRLVTVNRVMVFLPYYELARLEVSIPTSDRVGFRVPEE